MAPNFYEYEGVGHQLLQKWHQHSLNPTHKSAPSPTLQQHYLASTSFFSLPPQNTQTCSIKCFPEEHKIMNLAPIPSMIPKIDFSATTISHS